MCKCTRGCVSRSAADAVHAVPCAVLQAVLRQSSGGQGGEEIKPIVCEDGADLVKVRRPPLAIVGAAAGFVGAARFCGCRAVLWGQGRHTLRCLVPVQATPELDYLTHIVLRMYENKSVPVDAEGGCAGASWGGVVILGGGGDPEPPRAALLPWRPCWAPRAAALLHA